MTFQPVALNREKHANLRFTPSQGYRFAAGLVAVPVYLGEIKQLSREYVLLFDKQAPRLSALLGTDKGHNAYVNARGQWLGRYVPAQIRVYPFNMAAVPAGEGGKEPSLTVVIDPDAPHFAGADGHALLEADGQPTETLREIQKILVNLHRESLQTRKAIEALEARSLLTEKTITVASQKKAVKGFRVLNSEAFSRLDPDGLAVLRDSGALMLIHAHLISLTNLGDGPLARRTPQEPSIGVTGDDIFGAEEEFSFDFSVFTDK